MFLLTVNGVKNGGPSFGNRFESFGNFW